MKTAISFIWGLLKTLAIILAAVGPPVALGYFCIQFYRETFDESNISLDHERWGTLGDFLGGIINPVVGVITIILLVLTLTSQRRELKQQRRQIARQAFEQTFFTWLNSYRDNVAKFRYMAPGPDGVSEKLGVDAFKWMLSNARGKNAADITTDRNWIEECPEDEERRRETSRDGTKVWWAKIYDMFEPQLGAQLRTLFTLVRWVDRQESLTWQEKWDYVAIIRAQMSSPELTILFFNGYHDRGTPFTKYVDRYALLDNLPLEGHSEVRLAVSTKTHPFSKSAFDSSIARASLKLKPTVERRRPTWWPE